MLSAKGAGRMIINYSAKNLEEFARDFYNATGISLKILDANFQDLQYEIISYNAYCHCIQKARMGLAACFRSDKALLEKCRQTRQTTIHVCHAGLIDVAVPILHQGDIIGYIILGQMKSEKGFTQISKTFPFPVPLEELEGYYNELTSFHEEKIQSIANLATMLAKYILLTDTLKPVPNRKAEASVAYIQENFSRDLTVKEIAQNCNASSSSLYKIFRNRFQCTVGEYVNRVRVEKSRDLLTYSELSVEEISRQVGFSSAAYYSRMFKKVNGCSPLQYKKQTGK